LHRRNLISATGTAANDCHATPQIDEPVLGVLDQLPGYNPVAGLPDPVKRTVQYLFPLTQFSGKVSPPGACQLSDGSPSFDKRDGQCQKLDQWPGGAINPPSTPNSSPISPTSPKSATAASTASAGVAKSQAATTKMKGNTKGTEKDVKGRGSTDDIQTNTRRAATAGTTGAVSLSDIPAFDFSSSSRLISSFYSHFALALLMVYWSW
jgi:hypothetical protein